MAEGGKGRGGGAQQRGGPGQRWRSGGLLGAAAGALRSCLKGGVDFILSGMAAVKSQHSRRDADLLQTHHHHHDPL